MHHNIIVKVWAENEDLAYSEVSSVINHSINQRGNSVGWDYSGDITQITKKDLLSKYGVKTFAELERTLIKKRQKAIDNLVNELKHDLIPMIAPIFLNRNEAPLYINTENDELKVYIRKLMTRKKDIKKPQSFEDIIKVILEILINITKKDMVMYVMEQLNKLQNCVKFPEELYYTLQSINNHYAIIPCDNTKGLRAYYFVCDLHL